MTARHMTDVSTGLARVIDAGAQRLGDRGQRTGGYDGAENILDSLALRLALLIDATDPGLWPQGKPRITGEGPAPL